MSELQAYLKQLKGEKRVALRGPLSFKSASKVKESEPIIPRDISRKAKHLARLFSVIRHDLSGNYYKVSSKGRDFSCFVKLVNLLAQWERNSGLKVDPVVYLSAHVWFYGAETYPTHLISEYSLSLYNSYAGSQLASKCVLSDKGDLLFDSEVLEYLSRVRGESEEEVFLSLKESGLFSEVFLKLKGVSL